MECERYVKIQGDNPVSDEELPINAFQEKLFSQIQQHLNSALIFLVTTVMASAYLLLDLHADHDLDVDLDLDSTPSQHLPLRLSEFCPPQKPPKATEAVCWLSFAIRKTIVVHIFLFE